MGRFMSHLEKKFRILTFGDKETFGKHRKEKLPMRLPLRLRIDKKLVYSIFQNNSPKLWLYSNFIKLKCLCKNLSTQMPC